MENEYNLNIKSEILERQADFLFARAYQLLGEAATEEATAAIVAETIQRYYTQLGKPLTLTRTAEPGHLPFIEEYNDTIEEMAEDISILFSETEKIGDHLGEYFNYAQSEKMRIRSRIQTLGGLTNDLNLIANDTAENGMYFRNSFNDTSGIAYDLIMGEAAQVATMEGIVTLARSETMNRSPKARVKTIQGNGEAGTYHLMRNLRVTKEDGTIAINGAYVSDQTPNDQVSEILDGRPDTIFEYQMVNANEDDIRNIAKGYDFGWAKGAKEGDRLRVKFVIELEEAESINWINLNPYHPPLSKGRVTVYSIRTSEDGFEYLPLYEGGSYVINSEINSTPQSYRADALFDGSNSFTESKFAGQGVWAFPSRKAKYVEVVMDQHESYEEQIGHTYYNKIKRDANGNTVGKPVRIRESEVPTTIQGSPVGKYTLDRETEIEKGIEGFPGWRYVIGLRDINVMSYQFKEKSELVFEQHETEEPIQTIMLYANEKIPDSYLTEISKSNDWVQYFISIDDVNWHRISPMHHQPVAKDGFPPKLFEINGRETDMANAFQLHKGYLESDKPVTSVRVKMLLQRPEGLEEGESTTPIVEDYALRVVTAYDETKE